ncbi:hypothetical protein M0812_19727 [Anaeramoeba flamelloides]|uniref:Uncharacterized protein n=1 Tax=Anaeramoeba flamelloides TaxID=1746091 RepID=A0AAV7Z0N4_9EUKA|nr:hypothetical protein M0812_19727 [Anaeramoeba flamelloides]
MMIDEITLVQNTIQSIKKQEEKLSFSKLYFEQNFSVAENCIVQNRTILKRYQIVPETQSGSDVGSSTSYADSCDLQDTVNYIFHFHLNYKAHGKSYENTKAYDWDESCYELRGIGCSIS